MFLSWVLVGYAATPFASTGVQVLAAVALALSYVLYAHRGQVVDRAEANEYKIRIHEYLDGIKEDYLGLREEMARANQEFKDKMAALRLAEDGAVNASTMAKMAADRVSKAISEMRQENGLR